MLDAGMRKRMESMQWFVMRIAEGTLLIELLKMLMSMSVILVSDLSILAGWVHSPSRWRTWRSAYPTPSASAYC